MSKIDFIDTKKTTIKMLKAWLDQYWKLQNNPVKISEIDQKLYNVKSSISESVPIQGGASKTEENLCSAIDRKEIAAYGYRKAQEYDHDIGPCWNRLTEDERFYLEARFIYYDEGNGIKRIMEEKHIERSEAYNRSNAALERLSQLLFW